MAMIPELEDVRKYMAQLRFHELEDTLENRDLFGEGIVLPDDWQQRLEAYELDEAKAVINFYGAEEIQDWLENVFGLPMSEDKVNFPWDICKPPYELRGHLKFIYENGGCVSLYDFKQKRKRYPSQIEDDLNRRGGKVSRELWFSWIYYPDSDHVALRERPINIDSRNSNKDSVKNP